MILTPATTVFNDLVKIVTDSGVAASDLSTVSSDQAAVQNDQSNLSPFGGGGCPGYGFGYSSHDRCRSRSCGERAHHGAR